MGGLCCIALCWDVPVGELARWVWRAWRQRVPAGWPTANVPHCLPSCPVDELFIPAGVPHSTKNVCSTASTWYYVSAEGQEGVVAGYRRGVERGPHTCAFRAAGSAHKECVCHMRTPSRFK